MTIELDKIIALYKKSLYNLEIAAELAGMRILSFIEYLWKEYIPQDDWSYTPVSWETV